MGSFLTDAAVGQHHDLVHLLDGGQPVGDDHAGSVFHQPGKRRLHRRLAFIVQGAGGLVQDQDGRIFQENPGQADSLPLSAGQSNSVGSHQCIVSMGQLFNESVRIGQPGRLPDLRLLLQHVHKPDKSGFSFFIQLHEIQQNPHRLRQTSHIQEKGDQNRDIQRSVSHKKRPEKHREHGEKLGISAHHLIKESFCPVKTAAAVGIAPALPGKILRLLLLISKCLHRADSRQRILQALIHRCQLLLCRQRIPLQRPVRPQRVKGQHRKHAEHNSRQRGIDIHQNHKSSHKFDQRHQQILRPVMEYLRHSGEIIGHHRHQFSRRIGRMETEGLPLIMGK